MSDGEANIDMRKNSAEDFEDQFEDEYEEEVQIENKDNDDWEDVDENKQVVEIQETNDEDQDMQDNEEEKITTKKKKKENKSEVYLGNEELQKGEELIYDNSAYEMLHRATVEWPSLSIDVLCQDRFDKEKYGSWFPDYVSKINPSLMSKKQGEQGDMEQDDLPVHVPIDYPFDVYVVAGSQAVKRSDNKVYVMKWSNLYKTLNEEDDDEIVENEDDEDVKLYYEGVSHKGAVNRIRSMHGSNIVATWSDEGDFSIFNMSEAIERLEQKCKAKSNTMSKKKYSSLISKFKHKVEGYALDWSPLRLGLLASGG